MAATASIRIVKQFTYRGSLRNFSNRYHFDGTTPPDSTHWTTLADAIVTAEKACYQALASQGAKIVEAVGYAGGSEVPVFSKAYTTDGTGSFTNYYPATGDSAALVRLATADRSSKNHPVYLFSYVHAVAAESTSTPDELNHGQKAALNTYHASWITGFSDGAVNHIRCRPNSTTRASGALVETLLTHRDLPR